MKSIVKRDAGTGLWLIESAVPKIRDHEVLIKISKTSICGTDLHIYKWDSWAQKNVSVPIIIGHEFVGTIVEKGEKVKGYNIGDRITGEGHLTCGHCPPCRRGKKHLCMNVRGVGYHAAGCFAEYFALPQENLFLLPASISDEIAAIFDPFGNAVHTALSANLTAEDVLITGAGPIGLMAAAIARKAGARTVAISDINDYRLSLAEKLGATHTINVAKTSVAAAAKEIGLNHGFTVGMEMSGDPQALAAQLENAQHGAHIALLGILPQNCSIDWDLVIFKMLTLKGIYGREIFSTWYQMSNLLESGLELESVITHRYDADDFQKGIDAMMNGQSAKVILNWS